MTVDPRGQRVITFSSALLNASRLGTYADLIVTMYESGDWRQYETAYGTEQWRAHEFDYFLIACRARYEDVVRILAWNTVRAAKLGEAMLGEPSPTRRTLAEASAAWSAPMGLTLVRLAQDGGWLQKTAEPRVRRALSERAVMRVQQGVTKDEQARRRRHRDLPVGRRSVLAHRAATVIKQTADPTELRYVVDLLRQHLAGLMGRPASKRAQWRKDIAALNGNRVKLATRWKVSRTEVRDRLRRVRRA
jgi:hypothetical protein